MTRDERIVLLAELGQFILAGGSDALDLAIRQSCMENGWFTEENVWASLKALATRMLDQDEITQWASKYPTPTQQQTFGLVMAGNIPLVGFHDWLCVFVSGHRALVKLSEKDRRLLPALVKVMGEWQKESWAYTEFLLEGEHMQGFDAVIATGSNNTARYFQQYFGKYPHIIRRNRNSVAILSGHESVSDLLALGHDIFAYFGLGCRNVSKIYVPANYQFDTLLETLHDYKDIIHHHKYKNNFDYNLTLFLMNNMPYLNNGCIILREDPSLASRIACLHYEYYDDMDALVPQLKAHQSEIQCIVSSQSLPGFEVLPFGATQSPGLMDYPDGVDVMAFVNSLQV